ncbi:DUF2788 domain-containing protein [Granulosicoccaceae sp. 1_MG-2023]|nr:DUF2788 domain-containing protein [Granulosicoccaceae sp. 1_MG-2023]
MVVEDFEGLMVKILVPALMAYMVFIIYKLGKESNAGKFGMFVLFIVLGLGMIGFSAKFLIEYFLLKH